MDATRFETILRTLATSPSRRGMLRLMAGSALGGLLTLGAIPAETKQKGKVTLCHAGQTIRVSKKTKPKHLKHGDTPGACPPPPPAPPLVPVLTYQCPGPGESSYGAFSTSRIAQTFTAAQSGTLQQIQIDVHRRVDFVGDYLVELLDYDADGLTNTVLASATIPDASVPDGISTLTANFSGPPLISSAEYAVALSGSGETPWDVIIRNGNDCTGTGFHQEPRGSGPFETIPAGSDFVTTVTVLA